MGCQIPLSAQAFPEGFFSKGGKDSWIFYIYPLIRDPLLGYEHGCIDPGKAENQPMPVSFIYK